MSLERGIEILEGPLAIGRQADPIALPAVEERMVAKGEGGAATFWGDKPLLTIVQTYWMRWRSETQSCQVTGR